MALNNTTDNFTNTDNDRKLAKQSARLVFLLKCRRWNIFPRFILDRTNREFIQSECSTANDIVKKSVENLRRAILNAEIADCNYTITRLKSTQLIDLSLSVSDTASNNQQQSFKNQLNKHNKQLHDKFIRLKSQQTTLDDIKFELCSCS